MPKNRVMYISGPQANYLLSALDEYCKTGSDGKVRSNSIPGYTLEEIQELRDTLFANHQHPEEQE